MFIYFISEIKNMSFIKNNFFIKIKSYPLYMFYYFTYCGSDAIFIGIINYLMSYYYTLK